MAFNLFLPRAENDNMSAMSNTNDHSTGLLCQVLRILAFSFVCDVFQFFLSSRWLYEGKYVAKCVSLTRLELVECDVWKNSNAWAEFEVGCVNIFYEWKFQHTLHTHHIHIHIFFSTSSRVCFFSLWLWIQLTCVNILYKRKFRHTSSRTVFYKFTHRVYELAYFATHLPSYVLLSLHPFNSFNNQRKAVV